MSIGPYAPGWLLRLSGPAVGVGCALLTDASSGLVLVAAGLAALTMIWPASVAPTALALLLGLFGFALPDRPYEPRALALLAGVHLMMQLSALAARSTWRRRVELSALGPPCGATCCCRRSPSRWRCWPACSEPSTSPWPGCRSPAGWRSPAR